MFFLPFMAVRALYRTVKASDQKRAANPKPYPHPPVIVAILVIPAILFFAFAAGHGGLLAVFLIPLLLGGVMTVAFVAAQVHKVKVPEKIAAERYAKPPVRHAGTLPPPRRTPSQPRQATNLLVWQQLAATGSTQSPRTREDRVNDILSVPCDVCDAPTGISCGMMGPIVILRTYPLTFAHTRRLAKAVDSGAAQLSEVEAQFGGKIPEGISL